VDGKFDLEEQFQATKKDIDLNEEDQKMFENWNYAGADPTVFKSVDDDGRKRTAKRSFSFYPSHATTTTTNGGIVNSTSKTKASPTIPSSQTHSG